MYGCETWKLLITKTIAKKLDAFHAIQLNA